LPAGTFSALKVAPLSSLANEKSGIDLTWALDNDTNDMNSKNNKDNLFIIAS